MKSNLNEEEKGLLNKEFTDGKGKELISLSFISPNHIFTSYEKALKFTKKHNRKEEEIFVVSRWDIVNE